jgi:hypothetical protein
MFAKVLEGPAVSSFRQANSYPKDGGSMFLHNAGNHFSDHHHHHHHHQWLYRTLLGLRSFSVS